MRTISVQQVQDPNAALGIAATYVASHPPFGSCRADKLVGSLAGQIRRSHYAFAVRDGIIVGYVGWALCQPDIAKAWIEHGRAPASEHSCEGDVVVPIIVIADVVIELQNGRHAWQLAPGTPCLSERPQRSGSRCPF